MDWLQDNAFWLIPAVIGIVEAYRQREGSKAEKLYSAGEAAYEKVKEAEFAKATKKLGKVAAEIDPWVDEMRAKLDAADVKLRALRPKKGRGLKAK